jgi:hypothetical protein
MNTDKVLALALEADEFAPRAEWNEAAYVLGEKALLKFAALIQQQMESDGWRQCAEGQGTTQFCGIAEELRKDAERQWVGLTDEEKQNAYLKIDSWDDCVNFIEAKLKEKNNA